MRTVSVQELKKRLSALVTEASRGHQRPVAYLSAAGLQHLHLGGKFGKADLKPLLKKATRGRYLEMLAEDRRGHPEDR